MRTADRKRFRREFDEPSELLLLLLDLLLPLLDLVFRRMAFLEFRDLLLLLLDPSQQPPPLPLLLACEHGEHVCASLGRFVLADQVRVCSDEDDGGREMIVHVPKAVEKRIKACVLMDPELGNMSVTEALRKEGLKMSRAS